MIKKIFFVLMIFVVFFVGYYLLIIPQKSQRQSQRIKSIKNDGNLSANKISPSGWPLEDIVIKSKNSIFIPDWTINSVASGEAYLNQFDRLIYFGKEENLPLFLNIASDKEKWFTFKITAIPDKNNWSEIIQKQINIVKDHNLYGIVVDLEITGLPTDNLISRINNFVEYFSAEIKKYAIPISLAVYGDVFYRKRPYDFSFLEKKVDEVMVMAYDFSKSYGAPGPNFPYEKDKKYDYDFKQLVDDFLRFVPPQKLTVIFGMYGYDWLVDEKRQPIRPAKALTLKQIKEKFFNHKNFDNESRQNMMILGCVLKNCLAQRDDQSKEVEINYTISSSTPDSQGIYRIDYHIVWFEDEESVKIKMNYLKKKKVGSVAYWAYGYF